MRSASWSSMDCEGRGAGLRRRQSEHAGRVRQVGEVALAEARVGQAELLLDRQQVRRLVIRNARDRNAELGRDHQRPAVRLDHLGIPFGVRDRVRPADDPVIGEQHRVVMLHERYHGFGKLLRARSFVGRHGAAADEDVVLGNDRGWRHVPGDGIRSRMRRVAVHDALRLRNRLVDLEVQQDLAGPRPGADQLVALEIDHANVFGPQVGLADQGRSAKDFVRADAIGDIAAVAVHVLPMPELPADGDDLVLDLLRFVRVVQVANRRVDGLHLLAGIAIGADHLWRRRAIGRRGRFAARRAPRNLEPS